MPKRIEPVDQLVGQNIRIFRVAKGFSQTKLGEELGITFQQIQKYEKGVNRVGSSRLVKIAAVLGVPISRLFDNTIATTNAALSSSVVTDLLTSPYAVQMLKAFAKLPNNQIRRSLVSFTEAINDRARN